ncbi:1-acyl-sn-glycerol-3-phosphate acyltransferase [uncultured Corynebacterium sp.]|uniref:lysophospholipid acyltransferase family protein n=1 Tax=uncultured Corynebacterium sp. TaxID=159447 RepID=UPI002615EE1A|nr:lysophospholipid acyltransferase family protein [uncultured Corynebacterium sp.]
MSVPKGYRADSHVFLVPEDAPVTPIQPGWRREYMYRLIKATVTKVLRLQGARFYVHGLEHVPAEGPVIIAGNHIGYYDFISGALPGLLRGHRPTRYMAKKELFDHWLMGPISRAVGHVEVDRSLGAASIDEAVKRLGEGELIGIYPEGTLSETLELKQFKTGAARIAQASGAPLIPIGTWGTQRFWVKAGRKEMGRAHIPVLTLIGPPIDTTGTAEEVTERLKRAVDKLVARAREQYAELENGR